MIEQSADQNKISALADGAKLAIQSADIDYDDNYEDGASNSAKINQLAFQTNSEQLVKSEPTDNSQVGGRINKAGYQLKKVNNLLAFFVGI